MLPYLDEQHPVHEVCHFPDVTPTLLSFQVENLKEECLNCFSRPLCSLADNPNPWYLADQHQGMGLPLLHSWNDCSHPCEFSLYCRYSDLATALHLNYDEPVAQEEQASHSVTSSDPRATEFDSASRLVKQPSVQQIELVLELSHHIFCPAH